MAQLLKGKKLEKMSNKSFSEVDAEQALNGKVVALYFSAHWCPPCKAFTPVLKDFYDVLVSENEEPFEVVFVSCDRSKEDQQSYMKELHGDWCTLPYGDETVDKLSEKYRVSGIPMLVIIKPDGTPVKENARTDVQGSKAPNAVFSEWKTACGL